MVPEGSLGDSSGGPRGTVLKGPLWDSTGGPEGTALAGPQAPSLCSQAVMSGYIFILPKTICNLNELP